MVRPLSGLNVSKDILSLSTLAWRGAWVYAFYAYVLACRRVVHETAKLQERLVR